MIRLVIGGYAQGKWDYVRKQYKEGILCESALPDRMQVQEAKERGEALITNRIHKWVRSCVENGMDPQNEWKVFLKEWNTCEDLEWIAISDEVGNGIVPMEAMEREYREQTGRLLIELAKEADEVVRVVCGIGQKIK